MEAKDTVMNHMDAIDTYNHYRGKYEEEMESLGQPIVQSQADKAGVDGHSLAQAEISFKLGATQAIAKTIKPAGELYQKAIRQGRREVVDWLINDSYDTTIHFGEDWQVQLREWGIE